METRTTLRSIPEQLRQNNANLTRTINRLQKQRHFGTVLAVINPKATASILIFTSSSGCVVE